MAIQDHNLKISEQEYRDLEIPSYSMLSAIDKQGVDVIKGVKSSFNLKFGSLVDVMCFEPHRVNELFYKGGAVKSPTTSHKKVVDEILESITVPLGAIQNIGTGPFKRKRAKKISDKLEDYRSLIINTAKKHGVLKSYSEDKLVDTIVKSSGLYFKDRLTSRGKTLIKPEMWALAHETAKTLQTHPFTGKYFAKKVKGVEIIYQCKFDTKVNGRRVKVMLDCLIINHNKKLIIPVDLKTGEAPCKDFPILYTSHRYYIQGALYSEALKSIIDSDFELMGYTVNNFEFVYISKVNPYKPMVFVVPDKMHLAAMEGFIDRYGYKYKGVKQLLEEYYSCTERGFCDYTEEEELAKGRVIMNDVT